MEISHDLKEPLLNLEREEIDITNSLEMISKMKPIEFFYFREKKNMGKVGINMEEKDIPLRYVKFNNKKKYLDADYLNVILIDAIKKQNIVIDSLNNRIKILENSIKNKQQHNIPSLI